MAESLERYLTDGLRVLEETRARGLDGRVERAVSAIASALLRRLPLLVCGNGGSAADAMHIAGELGGRFALERPGLKVIALGADAASLTAWSNDYSYESALARQVEAYGEAAGVLWGLSTSGNSKNVVAAFDKGRKIGMTTIALTGDGGGSLAPLADILIDVPSRSTPRVQEMHICIYHYICARVEVACAAALAPGKATQAAT